jgi:hypothetical protein
VPATKVQSFAHEGGHVTVAALFQFQKTTSNPKGKGPTMYLLFIPSALTFVLIAVTQVVSEMFEAFNI